METSLEKPIVATQSVNPRGDVLTLWLGILFSAGFSFLIWLTGDMLKVFPGLSVRLVALFSTRIHAVTQKQ